MHYFMTPACRYEEHYAPEHTYTFIGPCRKTGKEYRVTVKGPDLYRYQQGAKIQVAFPYLSPGDREFLMTGLSPEGWDLVFGSPEDEED